VRARRKRLEAPLPFAATETDPTKDALTLWLE
jgi:hypothetical protein